MNFMDILLLLMACKWDAVRWELGALSPNAAIGLHITIKVCSNLSECTGKNGFNVDFNVE